MPPESEHNPIQYWHEVLSFYRDLIDQYGWNQRPMLELVEQVMHSPWVEKIYPSTSHAALGISLHEHYEQRVNSPMVYILYLGNGDMFEVIYQRGQGDTVYSEPHLQVDDKVWECVVDWVSGNA